MFNDFHEIVTFSIVFHVVHNKEFTPSTNHAENPPKLVTMSSNFKSFCTEFCLINFYFWEKL